MEIPNVLEVDISNLSIGDNLFAWTITSSCCPVSSDTVNIQVGNSTSVTISDTALDSYDLNGQNYTQSGTYNQILTNKKNINQQNQLKNQNSDKSKPQNKNESPKKDLKTSSPKKAIPKRKDDFPKKAAPIKKDIPSKKESYTQKETPKKKEPAMKEIVREKKVKKDIPLRAKNDPRQKS